MASALETIADEKNKICISFACISFACIALIVCAMYISKTLINKLISTSLGWAKTGWIIAKCVSVVVIFASTGLSLLLSMNVVYDVVAKFYPRTKAKEVMPTLFNTAAIISIIILAFFAYHVIKAKKMPNYTLFSNLHAEIISLLASMIIPSAIELATKVVGHTN